MARMDCIIIGNLFEICYESVERLLEDDFTMLMLVSAIFKGQSGRIT